MRSLDPGVSSDDLTVCFILLLNFRLQFQLHDYEYARDVDLLVNESLPAMQKIRESGKARYIGINGYPTSIYKYTHRHTHAHTHTRAHTERQGQIHRHQRIPDLYIQVQTRTHTHMHTHNHTYTRTHTHMHTHAHTHTERQSQCIGINGYPTSIYKYTYTHAHTHAHAHTHTRTHTRTHTHTRAHTDKFGFVKSIIVLFRRQEQIHRHQRINRMHIEVELMWNICYITIISYIYING